MVNEKDCNALAITSLLKSDFPGITSEIENICNDLNIKLEIIGEAKDYWCRDFMPVQVNKNKFVQFAYDPSYYKHSKYIHLKTEVESIKFKYQGEIEFSNIILDGGNVCYDNTAIITDKVFKDNINYAKTKIQDELYKLLNLKKLVIIPSLPYDITGHSDGMIRFINPDTLLINDFRLISSDGYWKRLLKALNSFNLILLPNDLHLNEKSDDATGDYINMTLIKDHVLIPQYNSPTDSFAHKIIEFAFPGFKIKPIGVNELAVKAGVLHCATWNFLET